MKQIILVLCVSLSVCVLGDEDLMTNGNKVVDNGDVAMLCDWLAEHQSVTNNHAAQKLPFNREMIRNGVIAGRMISANTAKEASKMLKTAKGKGEAGVVAAIAVALVALWVTIFADHPIIAIVGGVVIVIGIISCAIFIKKSAPTGLSNQPRET